MLTIISPAKSLDFSIDERNIPYTTPEFTGEVNELVDLLRKKSTADIRKLMDVSENIAELNVERFENFKARHQLPSSKQAILAYSGDVYEEIEDQDFVDEDFDFAQDHVRIISGLYGLVKPLDLIQPYRLEMKIRLENSQGKNLYSFWKDKLTSSLAKAIIDSGNDILINLASAEYFKAIDTNKLKARIITPVFKEFRNGKYTVIGLKAKRARGMMTDFIIRKKINSPEQLKTFKKKKYTFNDSLSSEHEWVFSRG